MAKNDVTKVGQDEHEVPLQVTVPPKIKKAIDLKSAETGRTLRALVLEGLQATGIEVSADDIAGRRGSKK
ncbi:MAG: hypothetical protein ACKVON_16010 [Beijerinckiaceae bacterium]